MTKSLQEKVDVIECTFDCMVNATAEINKAIQELRDQIKAIVFNGKYDDYFEIKRELMKEVLALVGEKK